MARVKGSTKTAVQVQNPGLGLNNLISDTLIKDTEASDLLNIEFVESGCPSKRRGVTELGTLTGSRVTGIGTFYKSDLTAKVALAIVGTKLYKYDTSWAEVTGVTFTTTLQTNFVQARDATYIHNGTDNMAKYDGTLTQPTTGVKAKFGIYYSGRHIVAGNTTYPSRIYISNPNNAADFTGNSGTATAGAATSLTDSTKAWGTNDFAAQTVSITAGTGAGQTRTIVSNSATALTVGSAWATNPDNTSVYTIASGNYVDITKDDGDRITGLGKYGEFLVIFKERSAYQLSFDASTGLPSIVPIQNGMGCVANRSVVNVENDLYFLSRKGVYVLGNEKNYFNVIRTNELSARVSTELDVIVDSNLDKCSGVYYDNKYMLAIPQGGTTYNNAVLVYDRRYTAWSLWTGIDCNSFTSFIDTDNVEHLLAADDNDGRVNEMLQDYNDNGVAISSFWQSKNFDLGQFDRYKRFNYVDFLFRKISGTISVDFIVDGTTVAKSIQITSSSSNGGIGTDLIGYTVIGSDGGSTISSSLTPQSQPLRVRVNKPGRTLMIKISNNVVGENFTILEFLIRASVKSEYNFPSRYKK